MPQTSDKKSESPPWEARRNGSALGLVRKLFTWALILGVVGFIIYGLRPRPVEVELGVVASGPLTVHVVEEGKTRIRNRYVVSAPVAGQMRRVTLKNGDLVKADETVIAVIEPAMPTLLDPRTKAEAEARLKAAESAKLRADQTLELARTAEKFALQNWERAQKLAKERGISDADRDNAERDFEMRARETRAAEFASKVSDYEFQQAKAALIQFTGQEDHAASPPAAIPVKSPVSGYVLRVMQESATIVAPGTQILEVGDRADMEIEAEILSRDAVAIRVGAPVTIEQWGGEKPLAGRVRLIEPAAFTKISALGVEEQRVIVLSDLVNPPPEAQKLGDRYRVEVRIAVWHGDNVLLVPAGALFREKNEWKTFVFDNGFARKITVQAGHSDGRFTEVTGGLNDKDRVLLHPPDTVKDGTDVRKRATE